MVGRPSKLEYAEALAYIQGLTRFGIRLGLERTRAILDRLGHPERNYPSVHIGGTNGKGSTVAMLEAIALAAGMKVARFTSPHLESYTERLVVNGIPIPGYELAEMVQEVQPILEEVAQNPDFGEPTEFEVGTILAFMYFARSKVDLALIEVGMGGRLDSTNVILPLAVGLTHIDLDHQEQLGPDLESIAQEKAGIMKKGVPVVAASGYPEVERILREKATSLQAPFYKVDESILAQLEGHDASGIQVNLGWMSESPKLYHVNLRGAHQASNAGVAFGLIKVLQEKGFSQIGEEEIKQGLAAVNWPGRLELIDGHPPVLMDAGHNPDGFRALVHAVDIIAGKKPVIGLIGIPNNRPVEEMAAILAPGLHYVIATALPSITTADPNRVGEAFANLDIECEVQPDQESGLKRGLEIAAQKNGILLITGSFYLIGKLRPLLRRPGGGNEVEF